MVEFSLICIIVWLFVLRSSDQSASRRISKAFDRLNEIERRLDALEWRIKAGVPTPAVAEQPVTVSPAPAKNAISAASTIGSDVTPEPVNRQPEYVFCENQPVPAEPAPLPAQPTPLPSLTPSPIPSPIKERSHRIEQLFIENWTGILGAVVVVAGVAFIGIYTALQFGPFYRFLMTAGIAGAMTVASIYLRRQENWLPLSQWVRSAGAAIFLFACAASGGLPGLGLQWIAAPAPALALLVLGMSVNMRLACTGGAQMLASLHVILSLVPLMIVPQSAMSLIIATVVALFGVVLSHRSRWDKHLLIVITAYLYYHVSWWLRIDADLHRLQSVGALSAIAVFLTAALVHYRKDYATQKVEPWPLLVHLCNWVLLSLALLVYLTGPVSRSLAFSLAGVIACLLARRARPLGIRWLYLCDTLIAQSLVITALVSLYQFVANPQLAMLAIFIETLLFLRLIINEYDAFLKKVAWLVANFAGLLFATGSGADSINFGINEVGMRNQNAFLLLIGAVAATVTHLYLVRTHSKKLSGLTGYGVIPDSMGWLVGLIVIAGLLNLMYSIWMETSALLVAGGLLLVARYLSPPGLLAGAGIAIFAAHMMSTWMLFLHAPWAAAPLVQHMVPLLMLAAFTIWKADSGFLRQVAIYLFGFYAALAVYLFFNPISPLIPGVAWLLLSLTALEIANRIERPSADSVLYMGYFYLTAFVAAYSLIIIQNTGYFGYFRVRLLIELFGLGVIVYWWLYHPHHDTDKRQERCSAHPYFLEFGLIATTVTNLMEVPAQWRPITWMLLSLALLAELFVRQDKRFRLYSIIFYWVSVADVAVIMSTFESPSLHWYDRPDIMSLIAIALQVAYIVALHRRPAFTEISFPYGFGALGTLSSRISARRNLWIYYPFFIGAALFLYWRFDHSVLTLLWAAGAFVVFILSAVLRENQFRHIALAGLGVCLLRLLLIDMAEANLGLRGLVFIGMGLLMLGMNAIYNRYRGRFQ